MDWADKCGDGHATGDPGRGTFDLLRRRLAASEIPRCNEDLAVAQDQIENLLRPIRGGDRQHRHWVKVSAGAAENLVSRLEFPGGDDAIQGAAERLRLSGKEDPFVGLDSPQ